MSAKATFWAWHQDIKPATSKLVLLCLADCHNGGNGQCNPGVDYIARVSGLNRKTVLVALSNLEKIGAIVVEKEFGKSNQYTLQTSTEIGTGQDSATSTENGTSPKNGTSPEIGTAPVPKTVLPPVPKLVLEPTSEPTKNLKRLNTDFAPEELSAVIGEFITHRRNMKKPLTQQSLERFLSTAEKIARELNLTTEFVITETIDAGWQSVKAQWLRNRLGENNEKPNHSGGGAAAPKQTAAQRIAAKRQQLAAQSPDMGVVATDDGDVWAPLEQSAGRGAQRYLASGNS